MAEAELGDDVLGEDPTVNRLQERAAALAGKEAALLVSSGTMGNLLGVLTNADRGRELIADEDAHVFMYEAAGAAVLAGVQIRPVPTLAGIMTPEEVAARIRPHDDEHQPITAAICIEDTHNRHGGIAWPPDALDAVTAEARRQGLRVHLDGARLFNAALATGEPVSAIAARADSLTFCLSKGLGCPAGSLFCASAEQVAAAHRWRKMLGGAMRQAGVLAAAGLVALDSMVDRLAEDHANARTLAEGLAELPGVEIDLARVQTNLVLFSVDSMPPSRFLQECRARGVLGGELGGRKLRFATHYGIDAADIQKTLAAVADLLGD